jgi:hypothetical protein
MFKRQYADSSILDASNTDDISSLADGSLRGFSYAHNLPFPGHISSTNIPLLQQTSLNSYFDIMHKIDTANIKEPQDYLRSVFSDNINKIVLRKQREHQRLLHDYDLISRKNIIHKCPVFGTDMLRKLRFNSLIENPTIKPVTYGVDKESDNLINNVCLNRSFRNFINGNSLYNLTYESIPKYSAPADVDVEISIDNKDNNMEGVEEQPKPSPPLFKTKSNAEHIFKIREDFLGENSDYKETINFTSTDALQNLIMTPNKIFHLCENLMNNFRIHIPIVISKGPQLVSSKFKTDFYVKLLNNLSKANTSIECYITI